MSYGSDMTMENNPLECGMDRFFKLGKPAEYMCREALDRIAQEGIKNKMVHLKIHGDKMTAPRSTWDVKNPAGEVVGILTSLAYSPKFGANLSFATVDAAYGAHGQTLVVDVDGVDREGVVCDLKWQ